MHILVVTDQHPDSLGGAQVAIRAQRAALERLGHRVTVAAPALHRAGYQVADEDRDAYIALPSRAITRDREYGLSWPGRRSDWALAHALRRLPPVDLVHVQGDFWGAMIGIRAARGMRVPLVMTMHNNVDHGTRAVTPFAPLVFLALRAWRWLVLGPVRWRQRAQTRLLGAAPTLSQRRAQSPKRARGAWRYLAELAAEAELVIAPSAHFAAQLEQAGVAAAVAVVRGGADDTLVARVRGLRRTSHAVPQLVWLGRMSAEKRVMEFVEALGMVLTGPRAVDARVTMLGSGLLFTELQERIAELGLDQKVQLPGSVPHEQALVALREADALVQTSLGFETQGLTPFEAALLGTPTVFCDPVIAADLGVSPQWQVADGSVAALAATLREVIVELAAADGQLRVSEEQSEEFLQSTQTRKLLELYERVLGAR